MPPIALFGAAWIVLHAGAWRGGTHTLFQVPALAECTIALLLRGRKPLGAPASILVTHALADLDTILILPVLLAVATVADRRERRTAAVATLLTASIVPAMPFLHGGPAISRAERQLPAPVDCVPAGYPARPGLSPAPAPGGIIVIQGTDA